MTVRARNKPTTKPTGSPKSLQFFAGLRWIDGRSPLLDTIEPYRREIFTKALDTFAPDGTPQFNMVLAGRAKKNWKSTDLVLAALYCVMIRESPQGSDALVLANDEEQAGNDLDLAKKLVAVNPTLAGELEVLQKEIRRRDGKGSLMILPAGDVKGLHGRSAAFIGYDEIWALKNFDLFEALAPDPTRYCLQWITSYDTIYTSNDVPLVALKASGWANDDSKLLFSWYSGDKCTDPAFAELEPELRANPSISSWAEGRAYLAQQRKRLPTSKYRRLHLNLPGAVNGAFLDQGVVADSIVTGRNRMMRLDGVRYHGFVDMSGGSNDEAVLAITHYDPDRNVTVLDSIMSQLGPLPFNPRDAVKRFAAELKAWGITHVTGDNFAGSTFKLDFLRENIIYDQCPVSASSLYELLEPRLNAGELELLDNAKLQEQLISLVVRGSKVTHAANSHDDWSNALAGAVWLAGNGEATTPVKTPASAEIGVRAYALPVGAPGWRAIGLFDDGGSTSGPPGGWPIGTKIPFSF
ncbi:hypothetical protein SAMN05444161_5569 [Rhizobiales bacterium GAS191]|nr:hypothetical protein SAMN05444161_5569 [Rhizobiales bacterium GAS191]